MRKSTLKKNPVLMSLSDAGFVLLFRVASSDYGTRLGIERKESFVVLQVPCEKVFRPYRPAENTFSEGILEH